MPPKSYHIYPIWVFASPDSLVVQRRAVLEIIERRPRLILPYAPVRIVGVAALRRPDLTPNRATPVPKAYFRFVKE